MKNNKFDIYINRELSWLEFNIRVLRQAESLEVPLIERIKFCAIYTSNIDEFYMVRAGYLIDRTELLRNPVDNKTDITAEAQLIELYKTARSQYLIRDNIYRKIMLELNDNRIINSKWNDFTKIEKKKIFTFFKNEIAPLLKPYLIDEYCPFPHIENTKLHVLLELKKRRIKKQNTNRSAYGIIQLPDKIPSYFSINEVNQEGKIIGLKYIKSEEILIRFASKLYNKYTVKSKILFKITRNADLIISDELFEDIGSDPKYLTYMKALLKKRKKFNPVSLEYICSENDTNKNIIEFLKKRFSLKTEQIFSSKSPLIYNFIEQLIKDSSKILPEKIYKPISPIYQKINNSMFDEIKKNDILINYPYHSIMTYLDFLREAAYDENVVSIKISLYRLSRYSEIISLLKIASEKGKRVTALIEIKARFDEENNIYWAQILEESGCVVLYGINCYKVHSKVTFVTRNEQNSIRHYAHIATGNYNEQTAKLYTDVGILTADVSICDDISELFRSLECGEISDNYRRILVSPNCMKTKLIAEIRNEKLAAESGKPSYICMKMNSLTDKDIIDALVDASHSGVCVELIIRGICCLRAGVPGHTGNIRVISIVGRYLEHSRIFIFGENDNARVYIGSADMMTRNTSRRIEVITPILNHEIAKKLIKLTKIELADDIKAWDMLPDGSYKKREPKGEPLDSQMEIYKLYR